MSAICVVYMELNREHFRAIIHNSASINLIQFLAIKLDQGPVFVDGMVNSTVVVVHSRTNFVKVV